MQKRFNCGDITASYLYNYKYSIPEIKAHCAEDVKIIIILRNPVEKLLTTFMALERVSKPFFFDSIKQEEKEKIIITVITIFIKIMEIIMSRLGFPKLPNVKIYFYEDLFSEDFYKDFSSSFR